MLDRLYARAQAAVRKRSRDTFLFRDMSFHPPRLDPTISAALEGVDSFIFATSSQLEVIAGGYAMDFLSLSDLVQSHDGECGCAKSCNRAPLLERNDKRQSLRLTPFQRTVQTLLYIVEFVIAHFVMLLVRYSSVYLIVFILIGAFPDNLILDSDSDSMKP